MSNAPPEPTPLDLAVANGPLLVVVTGPSGAGKDSVIDRLKQTGFAGEVVVTVATRAPRPGEVHGRDYYFVSRAEFDRMVAEDEFFEYAEVYGEGKGVPRAPVRAAIASGRDVLLRVDIQGAATVAAAIPACIRVFIAPPSLADLERRLRERNSDAPDALARRLATARQEIERAGECDYIVINHQGRLDETVRDLEAIMTAERLRVRRRRLAL